MELVQLVKDVPQGHPISVGYLPRDVASLRVRYEQLTRLDFHQLDCSLVGCSDVPQIHS